MCTIIVLNQIHPDLPVVIAANRDEFFSRPTTGPQLLIDDPRVVGGRDGIKGGSWMGANEAGIFVGLTNQRTWHSADKTKRSRGEVVVEALKRRSMGALEDYLRGLVPRAFNPFNLMYGTAEQMRAAYFHDHMAEPEFEDIPPGVHVLPNDRLNAEVFNKVARARELIEPHTDAPWPELQAHLRGMLSDRALPPLEKAQTPPKGALMPRRLAHRLEALNIKTPLYGTRSSVIATLEPGRVSRYLATERPPHERGFRDYTDLIA